MDVTDPSIGQLSIPSHMTDVATQVPTIKMRSVHVSVRMKGIDKGIKSYPTIYMITYTYYIYIHHYTNTETQTEDMSGGPISIATQCNLLNAPPLELLPQATALLDDSIVTEPDDVDLDPPYTPQQEDYVTE